MSDKHTKRCSTSLVITEMQIRIMRYCLNPQMKVLIVQSCLTLRPHGLQPARLLCPWDSPGKNTGVGCHALLQGIFPTQGSNPGIPHCRLILHCLSHEGRPYSQERLSNKQANRFKCWQGYKEIRKFTHYW